MITQFVNAQTNQDLGICGIVASTNVNSIYNSWACTSNIPNRNPCGWSGVTCSGIVT
jgi:hypothetical protein